MLSYFNIYNMPPAQNMNHSFEGLFNITTCQRTLLAGLNEIVYYPGPDVMHLKGGEAYGYLLEIVTGLRSQILAENEVVGQFKTAFKSYLESPKRDTRLIHIFEKIFMDNKEIRGQFLNNVGQHSYAGISKKILQKKAASNNVLILGSGTLAQALLKLLSKKFNLYLSARNVQRINELKKQYRFTEIPWPDMNSFKNIPNILSTIGAYITYFDQDFFNSWSKLHSDKKIFIDLGSPSIIKTNFSIKNGVYRLDNIFNECKSLGEEKELQIINAKNAIKNIVDKRIKYFKILPPNPHKDVFVGL